MRAQKRDTLRTQKCARRRRRRAHFCALPVSRFCARICQLAHGFWHGVQIIWPPTVLTRNVSGIRLAGINTCAAICLCSWCQQPFTRHRESSCVQPCASSCPHSVCETLCSALVKSNIHAYQPLAFAFANGRSSGMT